MKKDFLKRIIEIIIMFTTVIFILYFGFKKYSYKNFEDLPLFLRTKNPLNAIILCEIIDIIFLLFGKKLVNISYGKTDEKLSGCVTKFIGWIILLLFPIILLLL